MQLATSGELIERWANCERVLNNLPEHERRKHWDMSKWGVQTDCGTVACAAGHCGMDAWFRARGFKLDFAGGDPEISDVGEFFGIEGSRQIFFNAKRRPVEAVLEEVRAYLTELRTIEALSAELCTPKLGEEWPEHGGIFAGVRVGQRGAPNYFLIVGPEHGSYLNWDSAITWAASLEVGEHRDFVLPDRREADSLFMRVRSLFQRSYYWLGEQHPASACCAYGQHFGDGDQDYWHEDDEYRVRAVRRSPIR